MPFPRGLPASFFSSAFDRERYILAQFPALPLFPDAFLADCGHLTDAERGIYILLLMMMWRAPGCRLPNDDDWLARRFNRTVELFREQVRPVIQEFCQSDGNWITQKRLLKEFQFVATKSEKQRDLANTRWNKEKDRCQGNASVGICQGNAPTPTPTQEKKKKEKEPSLRSVKKAMQLPPDWTPTQRDRNYAASKGLTSEQINLEAERFKIHALTKGRVCKDWHAAWCGWIISPYQNGHGGNGNGKPNGKVDLSQRARELAAEIRSRELAAGIGRPDDLFGGDGPGFDDDWVIPERKP